MRSETAISFQLHLFRKDKNADARAFALVDSVPEANRSPEADLISQFQALSLIQTRYVGDAVCGLQTAGRRKSFTFSIKMKFPIKLALPAEQNEALQQRSPPRSFENGSPLSPHGSP